MNYFLHFLSLLCKIPAAFWYFLVGSLSSLSAVWLTNHSNTRLQRERFENDRRLKNREREMTFRKDIYTAAVGAIAVSMGALSKISDLSVSPKELSEMYFEQSSALAKVNLIAGEDAIRALANFGPAFAGAFLRLLPQRAVLSNLQGHGEFVARYLPFAKQCFAESISVGRLLVPLLVAVRDELDLSISKEEYAKILYQAHSKLEGQMNEFFQNIAHGDAGASTS